MDRVIIADNHPVFRNGVRQIVEESGLYQVVAEVGDGESCVVQARLLQPDCAILDLNMPGMSGLEATREIRQAVPGCRVIILSMHSSAEFVTRVKELGACAFVAKEDAGEDLVRALQAQGRFFLSQSAGSGGEVMSGFSAGNSDADTRLQQLTARELEVLMAISDNKSSADIANRFGVSVRTIHTHRQNICRKLELQGINSLLRYALENRDGIRSCRK